MSMTYDEVAELLAFCAVHDLRMGDGLDVEAWLMAATDHGWTADASLRVARDHYGQGADRPRLEPRVITDRIRAIRKRAAETFEYPVIPDHISGAEYPAWLRAQRDAHTAALVHIWATDGPEPPVRVPSGPPPSPLGQRRIAELTAGAFRAVPAAHRDGAAPTANDIETRHTALARACSYCSARPGQPCTRSGSSGRVRMTHPHPARTAGARTTSEEAS
jgi:hypothetical protein